MILWSLLILVIIENVTIKTSKWLCSKFCRFLTYLRNFKIPCSDVIHSIKKSLYAWSPRLVYREQNHLYLVVFICWQHNWICCRDIYSFSGYLCMCCVVCIIVNVSTIVIIFNLMKIYVYIFWNNNNNLSVHRNIWYHQQLFPMHIIRC